MKPFTRTEKGFMTRYRFAIMLLSLFLFLPPLSFVFQFTADSNFCGTWCPRMFFVWRNGISASAYFAGYLRSYMGVALVFGVLISTLFWGRYWCSHLCPVGGAMELGSRLVPRFLKIDFSRIPAPAFRYGYLSVYFLAAAFGIGSLCCNYCNFATIPRMFGAAFSPADLAYFFRTAGIINLGLVVLLGFLAKGGRGYCNLLCPIGALDALSNRFGQRFGKRFFISAEKCNGCGKCKEVCPVWAVEINDTARIDHLSCMPCGNCLTACPQGAITFGKVEPGLLSRVPGGQTHKR
ncbi:MAG: 4Fe-4S binding protein [Proteobacteria bacterium]|nr:4Fe-4S binding protein [Pseudomonadota bacterium]